MGFKQMTWLWLSLAEAETEKTPDSRGKRCGSGSDVKNELIQCKKGNTYIMSSNKSHKTTHPQYFEM